MQQSAVMVTANRTSGGVTDSSLPQTDRHGGRGAAVTGAKHRGEGGRGGRKIDEERARRGVREQD